MTRATSKRAGSARNFRCSLNDYLPKLARANPLGTRWSYLRGSNVPNRQTPKRRVRRTNSPVHHHHHLLGRHAMQTHACMLWTVDRPHRMNMNSPKRRCTRTCRVPTIRARTLALMRVRVRGGLRRCAAGTQQRPGHQSIQRRMHV